MSYAKLDDMKGMVIFDIIEEPNSLTFKSFGGIFKLCHEQDCCETVYISEIVGDLNDLKDTPILLAEEVSSSMEEPKPSEWSESWTWTFYKFSTIKGHVTIRWLGESNGYYSERVDFIRVL